ncbi:helix-turn-helix domain-containing protein [Methylorubrum rhodesianum]|uniref:AraC family transcriptional regulator n=1 Tax=Methylorubrum rhodesianum TaxID=29427 RepID=UPI003D073D28
MARGGFADKVEWHTISAAAQVDRSSRFLDPHGFDNPPEQNRQRAGCRVAGAAHMRRDWGDGNKWSEDRHWADLSMYGKSELRDDYQITARSVAAMARDLPAGFHIPAHSHRRSQLIYGCTGAITVQTEDGTWIVPPHRGVWVPGGVEHQMTCSGSVQMRTVYIEPDARPFLPRQCVVLTVSNLLRELIIAAVKIPNDYAIASREERVMDLILDEIQPAAELPLHLPMPKDRRLVKVCEYILANPANDISLAALGAQCGASRRTLERLFPQDTGLSFTLWRQQARVLAAIRLLATGLPVTSVAMEVGYESPSAFSTMFRRVFGMPPSDYFNKPGELQE